MEKMQSASKGNAIATEDKREPKRNKTCVNESRVKRRLANRPYHRLHSIRYDAVNFLRDMIGDLYACESTRQFPILSNERCGTWYAYLNAEEEAMHQASTDNESYNDKGNKKHSCYFKSTDGHYGTWSFSLKRLNLGVVRLAAQHGGCIIVDASGSKIMPDSMSRTIPIWACVLNRIVSRYRRDFDCDENDFTMDTDLFTPSCMVSVEEKAKIESLIDDRVNLLYRSKAVVDPKWLVETLTKPLRPVWRAPGWSEGLESKNDCKDCFVLVCISSSSINLTKKRLPILNSEHSFIYSPGAADDHSLWSRGLTPSLFWKHHTRILDGSTCEDETDSLIDAIVLEAGLQSEHQPEEKQGATRTSLASHESFHFIGKLGVAVGSRRSGRPPECWKHFDAVLNVTDTEYDDMTAANGSAKRYLQLPVREGKKDRTELERWLAVGIVFLLDCVTQSQRVLVHCAQGRDRSVAVLMASVALFCELTLPLSWSKQGIKNLPSFMESLQRPLQGKLSEYYGRSGLSASTVESLQGIKGRNLLLNWVRQETFVQPETAFLATKESIRLALLLIQQDREVADPSRSTMQKVNRFFMSNVELD